MMADLDENSLTEDQEIDLNDVIKLQALFRGALVRKWIAETRETYKAIVNELENSENLSIKWRYNHPCVPSVKRKSRAKVRTQKKAALTEHKDQVESLESVSSTAPTHGHKDMSRDFNIPASSDDIRENTPLASKLTTVETQTSFCEVRNENFCQTGALFEEQVIPEKESEILKDENEDRKINKSEGQMTQGVSSSYLPEVSKQTNDPAIKPTTSLHENSQGESFNHTDDIEHSLFLSMQNKTLHHSIENTDQISQTKNNDAEKASPSLVSGTQQKHATSVLSSEKEDIQERVVQPQSSHSVKDSSALTSTSVLTNVSSVWDSFSSSTEAMKDAHSLEQIPKPAGPTRYPKDKDGLQELRKNMAMELLWVQQAINSRKNYLRLKSEMRT